MSLSISLHIKEQKVLVVGGGPVALRKAKSAAAEGAHVFCVALSFSKGFESFSCTTKAFESSDLQNAFLVFACTNDIALNKDILAQCRQQKILCNACGDPSDFSSMATTKVADITIATSSDGKNIGQSQRVRDQIHNLLASDSLQAGVYLLGFGPGDPDLVTFKAHKVLQEADIIFYDDLIDPSLLDYYHAERVYVGKRKGQHYKTQDEINQLLFEATVTHKVVARLKGGDPFIFGRGGEELAFLAERSVYIHVVPGITSSMAAAASIQIPLTMRKTARKLSFMSAHHFDDEPQKFPTDGTLVLYMGASKLSHLSSTLQEQGWNPKTGVALVSNASHPTETFETHNLEDIGSSKLPSPLAIIIGDVVHEFSKTLNS